MPAPADRRPPGPRRTAAVTVVLGLLAGCATGDPAPGTASDADTGAPAATTAPAPSPSPAPEPPATPAPDAAALPDVPVRSAGLADVAATAAVPPVQVSLPALEITVPVDPVGVQPDGQMEIPPLAERAGWYRFGSSPAEPDGTAVIAAHVDSVASAGLGPFARLRDAAVGDVVDVALADGSQRQYAVVAVDRRAKPEIAWSDVFVRDGRPRLVLVTCGGTFQRDVGHYTDNVIVTAEPVGA